MIVSSAEDLGALLRQARRDKGWTQQQLAAAVGVTRQWVIGAEAGAPTARLDLYLDALRCVDLLIDVVPDEDSQDVLDAIMGPAGG